MGQNIIQVKMQKAKFLIFLSLLVMWLLSINAAHSQEALIVDLGRDGARPVSTTTMLNNIQQLSFSGGDLSVKTLDGNTAVYALDDIAKLRFGDMIITDVSNPPATGLDVIVYVTPAGDVVVECPVAIQSVALVAVDGKILQRTASVETLHATSLQQTSINVSNLPKGVYLLQIATTQGAVVKKIINN